jgi:transposase InsO family protein
VPHAPPHQLTPAVQKAIITLRLRHPTWGPRKLRAALAHSHPEITWPATSTIGEVLKRACLVRASRPRRSAAGSPLDAGLTIASAPNAVWTVDFKGEFRLSSGPYCFPLTAMDAQSRFLLGCTALLSTATTPTQVVFTRLFQRYGLPTVIRSDNGVPFASALALGRLSPLAVWWIRLGIRPERIAVGQPQQNGAHERMHKTLKAEATRPPSPTLVQQQHRFNRFQREYNLERPHEALNQRTPANCYTPSVRPFPRRLPPLEYASHLEIRRVSTSGMVMWRGRHFWLTTTLAGQEISFEESGDDLWTVAFGPLVLGTYYSPTNSFLGAPYWPTPSSTDA